MLAEDYQPDPVPASLETAGLVDWINAHCAGLRVLHPQTKRLACDDVGVGAMASVEDIVGPVRAIAGRQ